MPSAISSTVSTRVSTVFFSCIQGPNLPRKEGRMMLRIIPTIQPFLEFEDGGPDGDGTPG
nr:hypothetical protein Iba_scaffold893154CG0020 [Ipomoea batatas]GMD94039.1 hypothetical protein Iba_chr14fCG13280 [Ipomoea batatas]GME19286.1 hypothetical protein Iba_scaffold22366CG0120 [Ipomoea batatas]